MELPDTSSTISKARTEIVLQVDELFMTIETIDLVELNVHELDTITKWQTASKR